MEGKLLKKKYAYKPPNFFQRNFSFAGTMTAGEFWTEFGMHLIGLLCSAIVLSILLSLVLPLETDQVIVVVEIAVAVMSVLCVISLAALSRRRLRDVGYGAKSYLWLLLPVVGWIIFLARLCSKSAEPEIL